jgi:trans-2,3-dihydro-3-hydroxyanthranilate isomerase
VDLLQVDVFAEAPYEGNPLAVFPDASELTGEQMQKIAKEMNLSETTFVTSVSDGAYDVRIFTPEEEMAFAGHPTLGTAWALKHLSRISGDVVKQNSPVGTTSVRWEGEHVWLERTGEVQGDLESRQPKSSAQIARELRLEEGAIGLEARELGRPGRLRPAVADAGIPILIVPVKDVASLGRAAPSGRFEIPDVLGYYCFSAEGAGRLRSRGFFPGVGVNEDPGTGLAAAALGLYLDDRVGGVNIEVNQGIEMKKRCRIGVRSDDGTVRVGGRVRLVMTGRLEELP